METDGFFVMMILFLARKLPVCITFCRRPTVSGLTFTTYIPALHLVTLVSDREHYHKDNLRHLPRFPGFFVTFRILVP